MKNNWVHEITRSNTELLLNFIAFFIIYLAFAFQEMILLTVSFLILFLIGMNHLYLQFTAKHVALSHDSSKLKLFPGDADVLPFTFENRGRIPILKATWGFSVYDPDEATEIEQIVNSASTYQFFHRPFFISSRSRRFFTPKVTGIKRGSSEIRNFEIIIYDLLGLKQVKLNYTGFYGKEIITYPSLLDFPIQPIKIRQEEGEAPTNISLFEDVLLPRGSREYSTDDPFHKINWKDSARLQQLQTKIYDKVTLNKWTFVVNLRNDSDRFEMYAEIEEVLSQVAFISQFAHQNQITYDIYFNIIALNSPHGLYIQADSGYRHLTTVFETLARIRRGAITMDSGKVLSVVQKNSRKGSVIFHFGEVGKAENEWYPRIRRHGASVHYVEAPSQADKEEVFDEKMAN